MELNLDDLSKLSLRDVVRPNIAEDIGQLDIRVGKIEDCIASKVNKKLYVETVDVGERITRKASSELVQRYTPDQLIGRKVLVLCNANPVDTRGLERTAMLLCAEKNNEMELINPPPNSEVGEFIIVEGIFRRPEPVPTSAKIMSLYEKTPFEKVNAEMKINPHGLAVFRNRPLKVGVRQGPIMADTFTDCKIRFE